MIQLYEKYKGLHPGLILNRELKKRLISQRSFAMAMDEHPQTFNAITKGKRGVSTPLALKIESAFGWEEGTLVFLQAYYDIQKIKEKAPQKTPDLTLIRKSLFWDTAIEQLNWERQYKAVIQRVFERGNAQEKAEIERFYGEEKIKMALEEAIRRSPYTIYRPN